MFDNTINKFIDGLHEICYSFDCNIYIWNYANDDLEYCRPIWTFPYDDTDSGGHIMEKHIKYIYYN
jgi:hypothetical protein